MNNRSIYAAFRYSDADCHQFLAKANERRSVAAIGKNASCLEIPIVRPARETVIPEKANGLPYVSFEFSGYVSINPVHFILLSCR
jgi:hypothetical protein